MARGYLWVDLGWEIAEMFGDLSRAHDVDRGDLADAVRREICADSAERHGAKARLGPDWWARLVADAKRRGAVATNAARRPVVPDPPVLRKRGRKPPPAAPTRYQLDYQRSKMAKDSLKAPVKAIPVADRSQRCVVRVPGVKVRAHGTIATHVLGEHPICEKHFERILEGVHYGAHPNGELISAKLPVRRL